jgi:hypothetical protein
LKDIIKSSKRALQLHIGEENDYWK